MSRLYWTQKQEVGPVARWAHAMAYDGSRGRTVLFGGELSIPSGSRPGFGRLGDGSDTWEWDGENWTQLADSGPPARSLHTLAYDSARGVTVLFGGAGANGLLGDTWVWDGANWTQKSIDGPTPRATAPMAFDSTRGRTVLFGGSGDWDGVNGTGLGDTWEWDGAAWSEIGDFGAPASMFAALAFKGDSVALLDGAASVQAEATTILTETWSWDGQHWTIRQHFSPSPRWGHAMCYDTKRNCLVLFGGLSSPQMDTAFGDTWEHSEMP
jgi:hypothetical protein